MSRCVVIGGGQIKNYDWYYPRIRQDDCFICADSGLDHALAMGIEPKAVIGDFDSISEKARFQLDKGPWQVLSYPPEKDATDLELALRWCEEQQPEEIVLWGATGTRLDHTLANILLLFSIPAQIHAYLENENNIVYCLKDEMKECVHKDACLWDYFSLISVSGGEKAPESRFHSKGLKYVLQDDHIPFASSLGVSNEIIEDAYKVTIREGWALVIKSND